MALSLILAPVIVLMFVAVGLGATSPTDYALGLVTAFLAAAWIEAAQNMQSNRRRVHK